MICDVHAHYIPQKFSAVHARPLSAAGRRAGKRGIARHPVSDSAADIQGRFELMDAAGVERQILSPHRQPYLPDEAEGVQAIHLLNDGYAELAARYPDRIAVLRHAAAAAHRRVAAGDGARPGPTRLRRGQHEHLLPRPLGRRSRVRADLCRDEPARRNPVRASVGDRRVLAGDQRLGVPRLDRQLDRGRDVRAAHDRASRSRTATRTSASSCRISAGRSRCC